jgi:hypothetical protein
MARSASLVQALVMVARDAEQAGHGGKEAVYAAACRQLAISRATLMRKLKEITVTSPRKRRSDAGQTAVTREEALIISGALMESLRKSATKRLLSVEQAVDVMRSNGEIRCDRVDTSTGEIFELSTSTIIRALRTHRLHPDQLLRPAPAVELASLHPNHVWQIDASLCVLYYLKTDKPVESGLQVMDYKKFYKNKPANIKRIESDRVWSYEITDHYSGSIALNYVLGAESGVNLADSLIKAILPRDGDPFHGVPFVLMMDPGSANTSGPIKNFCRRMSIDPEPHKAGNARATGQVENARNIIECSFESSLRFRPVSGLDELNEFATQWARWYNATKTHSRYNLTRTDCWLTITEQQLRLAPPLEICRTLLTHEPESRGVNDFLRVQFAGREWDVSAVPRVMVGEKLMVTYNPYQLDTVFIVDADADGHEVLYAAPVVERTGAGNFATTANIIGQDYSKPVETEADRNRTEVELATMGVATLAEAEAARKAKALPFGGRIDPHKPMTDTKLPTFMPRRGTALDVATRTTAAPDRILSLFEAAGELRRMGVAMDVEKNRQVAAWYPGGVPEGELADLQNRLTVRAGLRVVGE